LAHLALLVASEALPLQASAWSAREQPDLLLRLDLRIATVGSRRALFRFGLPAARLVFFWFWVLSFDLACLRRANVSWLSVLSFDLVRLRRVVFFLGSRRSLWICLAYGASFLGSGCSLSIWFSASCFFLTRGALVSVCCFFVARGVCVYVCALSRAPSCLQRTRSFTPAARLPLFRGEKSAYV
jgi:hypothetical protein